MLNAKFSKLTPAGKVITGLTVLSFIGTLIVFPILPSNIPIHWSMDGNVRMADKWVALITALMPALVYALKYLYSSKAREDYEKNNDIRDIVMMTTAAVLIAVHWAALLIALGYNIDIIFAGKFFAGVEFIVLGNYLGRIKQNSMMGIRNPWTRRSEEVWKRVHHMGRYVYVLAGISLTALAFVGGVTGGVLFVCVIALTVAFNLSFSYITYKKLGT